MLLMSSLRTGLSQVWWMRTFLPLGQEDWSPDGYVIQVSAIVSDLGLLWPMLDTKKATGRQTVYVLHWCTSPFKAVLVIVGTQHILSGWKITVCWACLASLNVGRELPGSPPVKNAYLWGKSKSKPKVKKREKPNSDDTVWVWGHSSMEAMPCVFVPRQNTLVWVGFHQKKY